MRVHLHARRGRQRIAHFDHRPPFGEARAHRAVFLEAAAQPVESFGDVLAGEAGERFRAVIDFDAWDDSLLGEQIGQRYTLRAPLPDRFILQDDTADELGHALVC